MRKIEINDHVLKNFLSKFDKRSIEECWNWTAGLQSRGYGSFGINQKTYFAHRVAYQIFYGEIPEGKIVMHQCNNKKCVNPYHLKAGTIAENNRDAEPFRTKLSGELHPKAKLNLDMVSGMRSEYEKGDVTYYDLSLEYMVSENTVGRVIRGECWKVVV